MWRAARHLGAGFVKVYSRLSRESYFAVAAEAKRQGIPFAGHVPELVTYVEASDAGQRSFERRMGNKNGTWQTPTLTVIRAGGMLDDEKFVNDPRLKYMRPSRRNFWDPNRDFRYRGTTAEEYVRARRLFR